MKKESFESKFIKNEITGCWEWNRGLFHSGYGKYWFNGRNMNAHRYSYLLYVGKIDNDKEVCHTCDNKKCVNPNHLWLGTHKENMQDMIKKGRNGKGYKRNDYKLLKDCQIKIIRLIYSKQRFSQRKIAKLFNVSQSLVRNIVNYKSNYNKDLMQY